MKKILKKILILLAVMTLLFSGCVDSDNMTLRHNSIPDTKIQEG